MIAYKLTSDEKAKFGELFTKHYFQRGFGAMNKNDLEILIFDTLREINKGKGPKSNYQWSIDLHIPETKVRKLAYEADLVYREYDDEKLKADFFLILEKNLSKFSNDGKKIQFVVENRTLRTKIFADLKALGYFADTSHNSEIVSLTFDAFSSLLITYYPSNVSQEIEKNCRNKIQGEDDSSISGAKILRIFLEGFAKSSGEMLPELIKDIIEAYTTPATLINRIVDFFK